MSIGTVKDYYVAYSLDYSRKINGFPAKQFYWCSSSNFIFATLPTPLEKFAKELTEMNVFFTGEHDRIVLDGSATAQVVIDEDEGIVLPAKNVTELKRLSHVVHEIENNCSVVPKGSYKFTPLKETIRNEAFRGLDKDQAFSLENWQHFRIIQQFEKIGLLQRDEAIYNMKFLDDILIDFPHNSWSLIKDSSSSVANLRNILWPGYYAFHRVNTPLFGSIYIGNGVRNNDLPFMV